MEVTRGEKDRHERLGVGPHKTGGKTDRKTEQQQWLSSSNECAHRLALEESWVWWPSSSLGKHEVLTQVKNEDGETDKNMNEP